VNCEFVKKHVQDYLEGRLVALDRNAFIRHVDECPACEEEVFAYREVFSCLREMRRLDPPPSLEGAVVARLKNDGVIYETKVPVVVRLLEGFLGMPALARYPIAAAVVIAALYFPLAALVGLMRGAAVSFTDFVTHVYDLSRRAVVSLEFFEHLFESLRDYAKGFAALAKALATAAVENPWLLGASVATILTIVLIVSVVTRRKRSEQHATYLF
jgi:hypothetical protein